jgi:hypothetical protein
VFSVGWTGQTFVFGADANEFWFTDDLSLWRRAGLLTIKPIGAIYDWVETPARVVGVGALESIITRP